MVNDPPEFEIEVPVKASGDRVIKRVSLGRPKAAKAEDVAEVAKVAHAAKAAEARPLKPLSPLPPMKPSLPELLPEERVMVVPPPPVVRRPQRTGTPELVHDLTAPAPLIVPLADAAARNRQTDVYERLADEIIRQAGLDAPTDILPRLRTTILARLKDVRDAIETREVLTRLVPNDATRLSELVENKVQGLLGELGKIQKEKTTDALKREADDTASRAARRDEDEERARQQIYEAITGLKAKVRRKVAVVKAAEATEVAKVADVPVLIQRPKVQDVVAPPPSPLVGPLQELSSLTLTDFRRLSKNSREASLKIRDKVKLLSEQSLAEGFSGVKAWQQSEPSRLYQEILTESLAGKKHIPAVLTDRTASGKPTLTPDEFSAILELNALLRS